MERWFDELARGMARGPSRRQAFKGLAGGLGGPVLVGPDGTIGSPVALGPDAIRKLAAAAGSGQDAGLLALEQAAPHSHSHSHELPGTNGTAHVPAGAGAVGRPAPSVRLRDLEGKMVDLASFRGSKTLVVFWNPGCGFCQQMLPDLKAWEAATPREAPKLLVVSTGDAESNRALGLRSTLLLDDGFQAGAAFGAGRTPSAVLVDKRGNVASGLAVGAPAVMALANGQDLSSVLTANNGAAAGPKVGDTAPPLRLPDLQGRQVDLADFRGRETLLLFWSLGRGFCQQMLPRLQAWDKTPPKGAPKLLVVSTGTVEENRAMGLRVPVVLDPGFGVGSAFGVNGTPMAVLVDPEGRIASPIASGADAVFELANGGGVRA